MERASPPLYCEEQKLENAVLDIKSVYAHHELLVIFHNLQANLGFPKNVVNLGLCSLVHECNDVFKLRDDQVDDYIATTTRRLRCLGRVVLQGQHKRMSSSWAQDLAWLAACNDEGKSAFIFIGGLFCKVH